MFHPCQNTSRSYHKMEEWKAMEGGGRYEGGASGEPVVNGSEPCRISESITSELLRCLDEEKLVRLLQETLEIV